MKEMIDETKTALKELSKDELQNIFGGSWWETRIIKGEIVFIFHLKD